MHGDFLSVCWGAVGEFDAFEVGGDDVVGFTSRDSLGKFTAVVGVKFPADFLGFIGGAADLHSYAVHGMIVRSPDRAEDEGVGLAGFDLLSGRVQKWGQAEKKREDQRKPGGGALRGKQALGESRTSHRRRFPLPVLLLPLRNPLPRPSIPADWW